MNIKDLKPDDYKVIQSKVTPSSSGTLNVNSPDIRDQILRDQKAKATQPKHGNFLSNVGYGIGNLLGGSKIGEYFGSKVAEHSDAANELKTQQPIYHEGKMIPGSGPVTDTLFKGPSGKEIAGDALKIGTTLASSALPGASSLLGKTIEGAAIGYASDVAQKSTDNKDNVFKPGYGTAVGASLPFVSSLIGTLTKRGVALTTGAGNEVIDRALKNPDAVGDAIKQYATTNESKAGLVDRAKAAINDFLHVRGQEFGASVSGMTAKAPISKDVVTNEFATQIDKFGGKIKDGQLVFKDSQLTSQDTNNLKKAWSAISKWSDVTPQGMDRLRQSIGNHMEDFNIAGNSRANSVLGKVQAALKGNMEANIEGYGETLANYGKKTTLAKEVIKELNLTNGAKPSTQISSILKVFKKDPEIIEKLTTIMGKEEADGLLNDLSGAILSEWLPSGATRQALEGLGTLGGAVGVATGHVALPAVAAGAASASPRIVGTAATTIGKATQKGVGTGLRRLSAKAASKLNK